MVGAATPGNAPMGGRAGKAPTGGRAGNGRIPLNAGSATLKPFTPIELFLAPIPAAWIAAYCEARCWKALMSAPMLLPLKWNPFNPFAATGGLNGYLARELVAFPRARFSGGPPPVRMASSLAWRAIKRNFGSFLHHPLNVDSGIERSRATEAFVSPSRIRWTAFSLSAAFMFLSVRLPIFLVFPYTLQLLKTLYRKNTQTQKLLENFNNNKPIKA